MKRTLFLVLGCLTLISFSLSSQIQLPYYSGFDDDSQKAGWVEYKTAATTFSHWSYASFGTYSDPNSITHDYSPSTGITLTDNWFVSPGFSISGQGRLDSIRYKFYGFSSPETGDTIAIYILNGSQNPDLADSKLLLFDFRGTEYNNDYTYHIKNNIDIPSYNGLSYFAIRYRNTNCSLKWLSVSFDNISISGTNSGLNDIDIIHNVSIYPNPTQDNAKLHIEGLTNDADIFVYDMMGRLMKSYKLNQGQKALDINMSSLEKGTYNVKVISEKVIATKKLIVN
ncbi:MAG: T9SS type A sorting domain-containing protein [Bacteroidales bacterium]